MNRDIDHPLPLRGPRIEDVARAALAVGRDNPLAQFAIRMSATIAREMARLEAEALSVKLRDLPAGAREELVAERVGRSPRTVRRWANWRGEEEG
jgi:hypothetical protein